LGFSITARYLKEFAFADSFNRAVSELAEALFAARVGYSLIRIMWRIQWKGVLLQVD